MGEVYRARDTRIGREVAVKILPEGFVSDPDRLRRFEQEARAAGSLNHPNILVLHDVGTHDGTPYLVTELLEGETLRERLDHGALSPRKAIDIALQIARGLAAAHERGLVHRDLKPGNLFVLRDGRVKILDFGLAKLTRPEPAEGGVTRPTATVDTDRSVVMGTAGYMAPEQVRGQPADHRADIFAFGAILYEMLTGRRAFQGETSAETMTAILREEPPELERDGKPLPPALDRIVRHCLEKSPQERFQSASDIGFALEALSGLSDSGPRPALPAPAMRWRGQLIPALLGIFLLAAGILVGNRLGSRDGSGQAPEFRKLTFRRGLIYTARFSDSGRRVYYTAAWDGDSAETYSCDLNTPGSANTGLPRDSRLLGVSRQNELAVLLRALARPHGAFIGVLARVASGSAPREVLDNVVEADWDPGGTRLAVIHFTGNRYRVEYPIGTVLYDTPGWISHLRIAPDGKRVAFVDHEVFPDDRGYVMVAGDGKPRALTPTYSSTQGLVWALDGKRIYFTAAIRGNGRSIRTVDMGGHVRTLAPLPDGGRIQDIAPTGDALVTTDNIMVGVRGRRAGERAERDLGWLDWTIPCAISGDGRSILFDEEGQGGGDHYTVAIRGMDGSPPVLLGEGGAADLSPDGKWALIVRFWKQPPELVLVPTGVGEPRSLPPSGLENIIASRLLPNGKLLLVGNEPGHDTRAYVRDLDGRSMRPVTPEGVVARRGLVSPDRRWVVGILPDGSAKLYSIDGDETRDVVGKSQRETVVGWAPGGSGVYVAIPSLIPPMDIYRLDPSTGQRSLWQKLTGPGDRSGINVGLLQIGPDGSSYAYTCSRALFQLFLVHGLR